MESKVKVWLLADTHFGLKSDDETWLKDYLGYFEDTVIPLMKREAGENDILVHCGDVFDNRTTLGLPTISGVKLLFKHFSEIFNDIRIVVGNHDMFKKHSNDITSLDVIDGIPHLKVYHRPTIEVIEGKKCLFNPWIEDLEEQKKVLDDADVDYFFGHIQVGGSKSIDRSGKHAVITGGVNASDFKNAQVYAGHIHIKQDKRNIHYVGNPYHKDKGDIGNVKGITVLDISTGKTQFYENKVSPKFVVENIYDILNLTVGELKERWKNNYVELHMTSDDARRCTCDVLRDCLNTCYKSFDKIGDLTSTEVVSEEDDIVLDTAKNSSDYIDDYFKHKDVRPDLQKKVKDILQTYMDRK